MEQLEQRSLLAADLMYDALSVAGNALPGGTVLVNSTINNVGDEAAAAPFDVQFYLSQDFTLDTNTDIALGAPFTYNFGSIPATNGSAGFPFTVTIPSNTTVGNWFIIAVADSDNAYAEANESDNTLAAPFFVGNTAPVIGDATVSPSPVGTLGSFTLRATGVADSDNLGSPVTVRFYFDDGDSVFSQSGDQLIGSGTLGAAGEYTFTGAVPAGLPIGDGQIIIVASDNLDNTPIFRNITIVQSAVPTLSDLTGPDSPVRRGRATSLVITTVSGSTGERPVVRFYRDSNGTGAFEADQDQLLGTGVTGTGGEQILALTIDPAWGAGTQRFFAQSTDSLGQSSTVTTDTIGLLANSRPQIRNGLVSNVAVSSRGSTITFTARNVTDDDGPARVEFYRETGNNRSLNTSLDALIGVGVRRGVNWVLTLTTPNSFRLGLGRFYASAVDVVGSRSVAKAVVVNITANTRPIISTFSLNKNSVGEGGSLQFFAGRVTDNGSVARVDFYYDSDGDGRFNIRRDQLLTTGRRLGASNNFRRQINLPSQVTDGSNRRFFAVAVDNLGLRSLTLVDTATVTQS